MITSSDGKKTATLSTTPTWILWNRKMADITEELDIVIAELEAIVELLKEWQP